MNVSGRLDSEDTALVSEYAYALKLAMADKFSVKLHDAELLHGDDLAYLGSTGAGLQCSG